MHKYSIRESALIILLFFISDVYGQSLTKDVVFIPVDSGWAANSVNAVSFRRNSIVTWRDTQFISFYNQHRQVVVATRNINSQEWQIRVTSFSGNVNDAHNTISIMADGEGYLHLSWDHHNNPLRYARSTKPGSLDFELQPMTGIDEESVTYPEFHTLKNGNLLFLYRNGQSGMGNLVINEYDLRTRNWARLHSNLIDGEAQRNAYWQTDVDSRGVIHISWVWRENADVASNHDMCYARSEDNGRTWLNLRRKKYSLPITASSAEYALHIPQNSELINQTSMTTDEKGNPFIATYWRTSASAVPQFQIIYARKKKWKHLQLSFRTSAFTLSGMGTKKIPVSRPQILVDGSGKKASVLILFRDEERDSKASLLSIDRVKKEKFTIRDLSEFSMGAWEPSFDTGLWKNKNELNIFAQVVQQADAEGLVESKPTMVYILKYVP